MTNEVTLPVGTAIDAGDAARAEIYLLLGTLLSGPPDEAILDMLLEIDAGESGATPVAEIWQSIQALAKTADAEQLESEYFNLFCIIKISYNSFGINSKFPIWRSQIILLIYPLTGMQLEKRIKYLLISI